MTWTTENYYARQDVTSHGFATLCRNCELPVTRRGPSARRSPTGYAHWGSWLGIRCPGRLTGAQPGRQLAVPARPDLHDAGVMDRVLEGLRQR
jgi:hypothetical protein